LKEKEAKRTLTIYLFLKRKRSKKNFLSSFERASKKPRAMN